MMNYTIRKIGCLLGLSLLIISASKGSSLLDGLVGYWPFDGDAKDYSGNGNNGIVHGASFASDRNGKSRSAYKFGDGKYMSVSANSQLNAIDDFTLCVWIKIDDWFLHPEDITKWVTIASKGDVAESSRQFGLVLGCNTGYFFEVEAFCSHYLNGGFSIGSWMHVSITREGSSEVLYINGNMMTPKAIADSINKNSGGLDFGRDAPGATEYFYGLMDEIILYNRALSSSEIREIYNGGLKMCSILFNANGGEGNEMDEQVFNAGEEQKLTKNTYRKDGYVFQGWAESKADADNGRVKFRDEEEIAIDANKTLYAVWFFVDTTDKPPTLSVESADWTDGTITLRCEDANVGIANAPFYNLLYFDTAKDEWCNVDRDDLLIPYPSVESNGAGGEMLVTRITDKKFAKRNNGFGTVKYSIYDDDDYARMATCVTRNRHGLFVALDEYADGERLPTAMHEASVFRDAYKKYGDACGYISVMNGAGAYKSDILARLEYVAENKAHAGDVFVFYYLGHGGGYYVTCYGNGEELSASELITRLHKFPNGTGIVVVLNTCFAAGMISREDVADGMGNIGWIVAAQSDQNAKPYTFTKCLCNNGWFFGDADILDENIGTYGNDDGLVTFGELAMYGQQWSAFNNVGQIMSFYNSTALNNIVAGKIPFKSKSDQEWIWSTAYPSVYAASNGDIATAAAMTAANGCRTVGECYALGIDPEDPNDDLKITDFEMKDGKPVITLNHTEDGSGNSFLPRVKTLGKANLADSTEEWREVPEGGDPSMRFFKVEVEMP